MNQQALALVQSAVERRAELFEPEERNTDAWRLVHSAADGFLGLTVDRLGSVFLIEQHTEEAEIAPLLNAIKTQFGSDTPVFFKARWPKGDHRAGGLSSGD